MENFSRSGAFAAQPVHYVGVLDTMPEYLVPFPLIARPDEYVPDTVALDEESLRNEWLDIFTKSNALVVQAIKSAMGDTPDIAAKSDAFVR